MKQKPLILIVDDEPSNIKLLNQVFSDAYRLRIARNGDEALIRARTPPLPDLILLDVMMPGMDGFKLARTLQESEDIRAIPIVFLTAKTETEDIVRGFECGAVDYVTKPFNRAELAARVRTHVELKLSRERIERQREELARAAAMRDDVDRMMRHDLKGPLTPILSFSKLLRQDPSLSAASAAQLAQIEIAGKKLLELIDLSMTTIKMERGLYVLNAQPVDVVAVAENVVFGLSPMLSSLNADIRLTVDGHAASDADHVLIAGEELLCYNMLNNLIKNAVEAAFEGETIGLAIDMDSGKSVSIRIRNRRPVSAGIRDRFFEKYATADKPHGTGLGTFSAKLMATALRGRISMSTDEQTGTTVSISLPSYGPTEQ